MSDPSLDNFKSMLRDAVGEAKAEITAEADKFVKTIEDRFGSVASAKAQGVDLNFAKREGLSNAAPSPSFKAGRFMRLMAASRGNAEGAITLAKRFGDTEMVDMIERSQARQKAMTYSDFSAGGSLVPEDFSAEVIGLLYSMLALTELGADVVPMPNGNLTLPFLDTGSTASYVGEVAAISPSQPTTGALQLQAKKLAAVVPISNDLLRTASAKADRYVQNDLLRRMKVRAEQAFIRGTGAGGEPKGIKNWAVSGNKFNSTGATIANKVDDLGKLQRLVEENDIPIENGGYIMSPRAAWSLKNTLDGLGNFVFLRSMEAGILMGLPFRSTTIVQNTLGTGDKTEIMFGSFGHVVIGDTDSIEITVHPDGAFFDGSSTISGVSLDVTPMRAIARHDIGCRYRGKEISVLENVAY